MSRLNFLIAALVATTTACAVNNTQVPGGGGVEPPTGAPRQAKGQLPMSSGMMPKAVTAVKEMAGKPAVANRSEHGPPPHRLG